MKAQTCGDIISKHMYASFTAEKLVPPTCIHSLEEQDSIWRRKPLNMQEVSVYLRVGVACQKNA